MGAAGRADAEGDETAGPALTGAAPSPIKEGPAGRGTGRGTGQHASWGGVGRAAGRGAGQGHGVGLRSAGRGTGAPNATSQGPHFHSVDVDQHRGAGLPPPPSSTSSSQHLHPQQHSNPKGSNAKRRGQSSRPGSLWVLDGRIYNYPKPGAVAAADEAAAQALVEASHADKDKIHGMGPGGNAPILPRTSWRASDAMQQEEGGGERQQGGGNDHGGRGGGRGRGGRGRGGRHGAQGSSTQQDGGSGSGDQRAHHRKTVNKAAVGNHHRKDRAMRKQGMM